MAKRLDELACAAEAMRPNGAQHTGDDLEHRVRRAYATGHRQGCEDGERKGYTSGWRWGLVCGIVGTIGMAGFVVIVAAGAGWLSADVPAAAPAARQRPMVTA